MIFILDISFKQSDISSIMFINSTDVFWKIVFVLLKQKVVHSMYNKTRELIL